jgi:hypothetical protein
VGGLLVAAALNVASTSASELVSCHPTSTIASSTWQILIADAESITTAQIHGSVEFIEIMKESTLIGRTVSPRRRLVGKLIGQSLADNQADWSLTCHRS